MLTIEDSIIMASILCSVIGMYFLVQMIKKCRNNRATPNAIIVAELTHYSVHDDESRCPVCKIRVSNICFIPCQHALCDQCSGSVENQCPVCNAITGIVA